MKWEIIRSAANPKLEITVYSGHFATRHSHNSHYIDITRMKHEYVMAREAAITLSQCYASQQKIDTIVCLDGSEVIGAFLARHLSRDDRYSVNQYKNINVLSPEYNSSGQLLFRENLAPMIYGKDVMILISTVNSGKTARQALECVEYYGGRAKGIVSIFSTIGLISDTPIFSLFTTQDIAGYATHSTKDCPMCKAGVKIDALSNSFGFSLIK